MRRIRCYFCYRRATYRVKGYDLCVLHYLKIDKDRAMSVAQAARGSPPRRRLDRLILVAALEEVLGAEKVQGVLGGLAWFERVEAIRVKAWEIKEVE